jgi:hypothetical protein
MIMVMAMIHHVVVFIVDVQPPRDCGGECEMVPQACVIAHAAGKRGIEFT